ncbi:MAG: LTA synthase family protein [Muribaculum sp.]|nr:LTA synthase family protein [Muribaculaceae bacterium]MCM1080895.1 LTA synthase family protein [Muribaculum sp.]
MRISQQNKAIAVSLLFALGCLAQTLAFLWGCGLVSLHLLTLAANTAATGFLLLLPFFFLPRRWLWLQVVWMTVVACMMTANVCYLRVFGDYMSPANILLLNTIDPVVVNGAKAVMQWHDFLIFIPPVACGIALFRIKPRSLGWKLRLGGAAVCIAAATIAIAKQHSDYFRYLKNEGLVTTFADYRAKVGENLSRAQQVTVNGFALAQTIDFFNSTFNSTELSDNDLNTIRKNSSGNSTIRPNGKNLIVIVVESLNSSAVRWTDSNRVAMPFTNSLLSDSTVLTFTNMVSIAGEARSADGQFMYHTGLFPLRNEPFVVANASGPYPSLQRALSPCYTSVEIIGENASLWHHKETSSAYGFNRLVSDASVNITTGQDDAIFSAALEVIDSLPQPFYAMVSTMTMHDPYTPGTSASTWISNVDSLPASDAVYLERCHEFDIALAKFITQMKQSPVWPNTIVVIVSDHEARRSCLSPAMNAGNQFMAILNSGFPGTSDSNIMSQIDVYPTLLTLLGLERAPVWKGLGTSVINNGAPGFALLPQGTVIGQAADSTIARQRQWWMLAEKWIRARNKSAAIPSTVQ